ncbi:DNA/RNA non-specific endonuclease [Alteromonas mediterranea]|uniref:DNA/RNA non-specific endonuclease n=2 Tax=Alteromonas mediterranea TaxID=314275 RepID=UPI0022B6D8E9|nr:DNA/RNA non-specific endonuclease [Alteromonas mediterranea]
MQGYFKVVVREVNGLVEASAFIMQQNASRRDDYCTTEVTVDEVEAHTGLDIMPILPVESESSVEGTLGGLYLQLGCS